MFHGITLSTSENYFMSMYINIYIIDLQAYEMIRVDEGTRPR